MDAKTRRVLKAKQGKVSTDSRTLSSSEGYEGQVQVRDTKDGPMLFAKLKGKWIQSPLVPGGDFFVPKAFTADVVMPSANGKAFFKVPHFIPIDNILNMSIIVTVTTASASFRVQLPAIFGQDGTAPDNLNFYFWLTVRKNDRSLFLTYIGSTWQNLPGTLTILYK
mgnify:CR=1 FL=1